jgi:hypothetical protein
VATKLIDLAPGDVVLPFPSGADDAAWLCLSNSDRELVWMWLDPELCSLPRFYTHETGSGLELSADCVVLRSGGAT